VIRGRKCPTRFFFIIISPFICKINELVQFTGSRLPQPLKVLRCQLLLELTGLDTAHLRTRQMDTISVHLPKSLVDRIETRLLQSDFKSVDEYVAYIVDEVLSEVERSEESQEESQKNVYSKEDQALVEQRLKDLGYA
jgi:Arc/MetJ-type ribon-helix-helix transcriptional regulator